MCSTNQPIHYVYNRPICETELLRNPSEIPINCEIRIINSKFDIWHKLHQSNAWIYVLPKLTEASISCLNYQTTVITLEKTGIITLKPGCKLYTGSTILTSTEDIQAVSNRTIIPKLNIANYCCFDYVNFTEVSIPISPLAPINLHSDTLKTVSHRLDEISESAKNLYQRENHLIIYSSHYSNYVLPIIIVLIILYVCYHVYKHCRVIKRRGEDHPTHAETRQILSITHDHQGQNESQEESFCEIHTQASEEPIIRFQRESTPTNPSNTPRALKLKL